MLRAFFLILLIKASWADELVSSSKLVVTRNVDVSSQLAKFSVNLEVKNSGSEATYLVYALTKADNDRLSYITASASAGKKLTVSSIKYAAAKPGFEYYKIDFQTPLPSGSSQKLKVEYVLTGSLRAYPAQISQNENQFVVFDTNDAIISPYQVESDTTVINTGGKIISHVKGKQSTNKVTYTNTNLASYSVNPISIHYENNAPFIVVTSLECIIEVSHWGNVAIENYIEVVHRGAKLKGSFSRLDYQIDRRTKSPIVKALRATLPAKSRDIYYRDEIGNISTSTVRSYKNRVDIEIRPRFPLLGGWRTNYILGYNVPSSEFLFYKDNNYVLQLPFINPLFDDFVVESAKVKIILPETAHNIKVVNPFDVTRHPDTLHFTYLDTVGRPVINLEKKNLVEYHNQPFTIYYDFNYINILREPLIATLAFLGVFIMIIVFNRFDFSIARDESPATHSKTE